MFGDFLKRSLNCARNVEPSALGGGSGASIAATEADRARELTFDRVNLRRDSFGALVSTSLAEILELFGKLVESVLVLELRLLVQHLTSVAYFPDGNVGPLAQLCEPLVAVNRRVCCDAGPIQEIERIKFLSRMLQKSLNIGKTFGVSQRKVLALAADGPNLTAAGKRDSARTLVRV